MTALQEKIEYFKTKQAEVQVAVEAYKVEEAEIREEYRQKIQQLEEAGSAKLHEAKKKVDKLLEPYKAEQKAYFGTCTGETVDLLTTVELITKVMGAAAA